MKLNRIQLSLWLLMAGSMTLISCTKNDVSTISLIGTEYYVAPFSSVLDSIFSSLSDTVRTGFLADFGSIPSGAIPPKIEGSFVVNPKQRVCSNVENWSLQTVEPNVFMRFSDQHNGIVAMDLNEATETITDTVFVQGSGNSFVVYFIENKEFAMELNSQSYQVRMKRGVVMKGKVDDNGFTDFRYATIVMETEDNSGGIIELNSVGSYCIYKDGDGTVEKQEW